MHINTERKGERRRKKERWGQRPIGDRRETERDRQRSHRIKHRETEQMRRQRKNLPCCPDLVLAACLLPFLVAPSDASHQRGSHACHESHALPASTWCIYAAAAATGCLLHCTSSNSSKSGRPAATTLERQLSLSKLQGTIFSRCSNHKVTATANCRSRSSRSSSSSSSSLLMFDPQSSQTRIPCFFPRCLFGCGRRQCPQSAGNAAANSSSNSSSSERAAPHKSSSTRVSLPVSTNSSCSSSRSSSRSPCS